MWTITYQLDEKVFEVDTCTPSLVMWFSKDAPLVGPRLCLSLYPLLEMSNEDILEIVDWFREHGAEVGIINDAEEAHYNEQFVSDEDLKVIIESELSSAEQKEAASKQLHYRIHGGYQPNTGGQASSKPKRKKPGYIYLAYSETDHYKIGRSKGPADRIQVFNTEMPVEVSMLHTFETDDMGQAEALLHDRYDSKRVKGEWFDLSVPDIEWITSITEYKDGTFTAGTS